MDSPGLVGSRQQGVDPVDEAVEETQRQLVVALLILLDGNTQQGCFCLSRPGANLVDRVRLGGNAGGASLHERHSDDLEVAWALAADADSEIILAGILRDLEDVVKDVRIGLVESLEHLVVPINGLVELEPVVGAPGNAVDSHRGVALDAAVCRHLTHHPQEEVVLARDETAVFEVLLDHGEFSVLADERNHDVQVVVLLANPKDRIDLEVQDMGHPHIAEGAMEPDHRVVFPVRELEFLALVLLALVGPIVLQAVNNRPGVERSGCLLEALREEIHESLGALRIGSGVHVVHHDHVVHDELSTQKTDTRNVALGNPDGFVRVADVDENLRHRLVVGGELVRIPVLRQRPEVETRLRAAFVNVAPQGIHSVAVPFGQALHDVGGANDAGNTQLPGDDGSVAETATSGRDDRACALHRRNHVRLRHICHKDVARLHLLEVRRVVDEPDNAIGDAGTGLLALRQDRRGLFTSVGIGVVLDLVQGRDRAALDHPEFELAILSVTSGTLQVLGEAVELFHGTAQGRQLADVICRPEHRLPDEIGWDIQPFVGLLRMLVGVRATPKHAGLR